MNKKSLFFLISLITSILFFFPTSSYALTFGLIAPEELLKRGEEVTFTITIDTKGEEYTNVQVGMTYDTKYLEFINVTPGDTFPSISVEQIENGKLLLTATSDQPFSGAGNFAYVKFKIIADAPGSTEVCALFEPSPSPSTTPIPSPSTTTSMTPTPPKTGSDEKTKMGVTLGLAFIGITVAARLYIKSKSLYS